MVTLWKISEFSVSLGEMGSCLEQIAPHNDEESGKRLSLAYFPIIEIVIFLCI